MILHKKKKSCRENWKIGNILGKNSWQKIGKSSESPLIKYFYFISFIIFLRATLWMLWFRGKLWMSWRKFIRIGYLVHLVLCENRWNIAFWCMCKRPWNLELGSFSGYRNRWSLRCLVESILEVDWIYRGFVVFIWNV